MTIIPTQGVSNEKQRLILRAYASLTNRGTEPIHYLEIVKRGRLGRTQVCGVNSFFVNLGLLKEVDKGKYLPTKATLEFLGDDFNKQNYEALNSVLKSSRLYDFVQGQIAIHGSIIYDDLVQDLLKEAQSSESYRAKRALDWLLFANLIEITEEGYVRIKE
jgi:hypothetical protein